MIHFRLWVMVVIFAAVVVGMALVFFDFLSPTPSPAKQQTITLSVYFGHKNISQTNCSAVLPVKRIVPYTTGVAREALRQLFIGPTTEEKQSGYSSAWESDPSLLKGVFIQNSIAYVDLKDIRHSLAGISSSCGSAAAIAQLTATLTQFSSISDVRIAINENPQIFYDWIQMGCVTENNYCNPTPFLIESVPMWDQISSNNFSLAYPHAFIKSSSTLMLDPLKTFYPATKLTYTIDTPHCALSGSCTPYTNNMVLYIASIPISYQEMRTLLAQDIAPEPIRSKDQEGFSISMGVEGEGMLYYVFPLNKKETLVIARSYIDESTLISYKTAPGFIPFEDQKTLAQKILSTLTISHTTSP